MFKAMTGSSGQNGNGSEVMTKGWKGISTFRAGQFIFYIKSAQTLAFILSLPELLYYVMFRDAVSKHKVAINTINKYS